MKVIYGIGKAKPSFKNPVLVIGVFDGLHRGHQKLLAKALQRAKEIDGEVIVLTFDPHPVQVLRPEIYLPLISTLPQRLALIEQMDIDHCIVVNFTKRFSKISPENFIKRYILQFICPQEIFVGCDFRFGNNRSGTLDVFKEAGEKHGFKLNVVHSLEKRNEKISSTHIRHLVQDGKLSEASSLLGRKFSILGVVEKGQSLGIKLGFPTANLYPSNEIIPPNGVYAVCVTIGRKQYQGMANVGMRPTVNTVDSDVNVEVHLFDFKKNLLGKTIHVEFLRKIRDEKKFSTKEKLIQQIIKDEKHIKSLF